MTPVTRRCQFIHADSTPCGAPFTVPTNANRRRYCPACSRLANKSSKAISEQRLRAAKLADGDKPLHQPQDTRPWSERREAIRARFGAADTGAHGGASVRTMHCTKRF